MYEGSLTSYFQEIGRAGRDGQDAEATLFFSEADAARIRRLKTASPNGATGAQAEIIQSQINEMLTYARTVGCKRYTLLEHFGELLHDGATIRLDCDNCSSCNARTQDLPLGCDYSGEGEVSRTVPTAAASL